jgi:iron complex transport system ATP-binding protein
LLLTHSMRGDALAFPAAIIELDCVSYRQRGVDILTDVSWSIQRGERWAVLGPNGCGKTTMLRIACGYLWPTSGVVRRFGEELVDLRELRKAIGWVAHDLAPLIPPREHVIATVVSGKFAQLGLKPYGDTQPTDADFDAARSLLTAMGCADLADKQFGVLSQGERQQTLVARARMVDPLLIVLDEPCAGMDPGVRERFLAWLNEQALLAPHPALALVTHHVEEIMPAFNRTLMLERGRIVATGPTDQVVTSERLASAYGVGVDRIEHVRGRAWPIWG